MGKQAANRREGQKGESNHLGDAEWPSLVEVDAVVAGPAAVRGEHCIGIVLRAVEGPLAEPQSVAVVPPGPLVVGHAIDDLVADIGVFEPDANQLHQVARADPDGESPAIHRPFRRIADADAENLGAVFVRVESAHALAEDLAETVARIGPDRRIDTDRLRARVEAHRMIAGREDDALDALEPRRLEQVVAADDIGGVDRVPFRLDRIAAEVNDAVDAGDRPSHRLDIGEIGRHDVLTTRRIAHRAHIGQAQAILGAQKRPDHRGDAAGGASDENVFHRPSPSRFDSSVRRAGALPYCPSPRL